MQGDKVLAVEGGDDAAFFDRLLTDIGVAGVQVIPYNGRDRMPSFVRAVARLPDFADRVTHFALTRDCDDSRLAAEQSMASCLSRAGLPAPGSVASRGIPGSPATSVIAVPPTSDTGMLEDLLYASLDGRPITACVAEFLACAENTDGGPGNLAKARVYAYLATRERPINAPAVSVLANAWDTNSNAFDEIKDCLRWAFA